MVVTDNASTITKAVELSDYESLRCAGHTINLCVKDITEKEEKIKDLLAKCRAIVGHFKRSSKATQKLKTFQNRLEIEKPQINSRSKQLIQLNLNIILIFIFYKGKNKVEFMLLYDGAIS